MDIEKEKNIGIPIHPMHVDILKKMPKFVMGIIFNPSNDIGVIRSKLNIDNFNMVQKIERKDYPANKIKILYNTGESKEFSLVKKIKNIL